MRMGDVLEDVAREKHFLDYHPPSLLLHSYSFTARMADSSLHTLTALLPTPPGVSGDTSPVCGQRCSHPVLLQEPKGASSTLG